MAPHEQRGFKAVAVSNGVSSGSTARIASIVRRPHQIEKERYDHHKKAKDDHWNQDAKRGRVDVRIHGLADRQLIGTNASHPPRRSVVDLPRLATDSTN